MLYPLLRRPRLWMHQRPERGFSLIELLVVIAIISLLIALLMPALQRARFQARTVICQGQLRQITLGVLTYTEDALGWYPTNGTDWVIRVKTFGWPTSQQYGGPRIQETAYRLLGTYYSSWSNNQTLDQQGTKALTYRNPLWVCPQGVQEKRNQSYYSLYSDAYGACSFATYVGPFPAPRSIDEPQYMMRKRGDTWTMRKIWQRNNSFPADPRYNILASDVTHRMGHSGGGISTNHMWKGTRNPSTHSYLANQTAGIGNTQAFSNYALDDGSVQTFGPFKWNPDLSTPTRFHIGGQGGIGADPFAVPAEWGRYGP